MKVGWFKCYLRASWVALQAHEDADHVINRTTQTPVDTGVPQASYGQKVLRNVHSGICGQGISVSAGRILCAQPHGVEMSR
jgi:hypothetical protein